MVFREVDVEHARQVRSSDVARLCCEDANEHGLCESVRRHDACQRADQRQCFSRDIGCEHTRQVRSSDVARLCGEASNEQVLRESVRWHDACRRTDQRQWCSEMFMLSIQDKREATMLCPLVLRQESSQV